MRNLSDATSPETSNLTKTGAMLESLYYRVNGKGVEISVQGTENLLKAIYTSVERPWANLSDDEVAACKALIADLSGV